MTDRIVSRVATCITVMDDPILGGIAAWKLWQRLVIGALLGIWWTISDAYWTAIQFTMAGR